MAKMVSTAADPSRDATCTSGVVVGPDKDAWFAYCPTLKGYGVPGDFQNAGLEMFGLGRHGSRLGPRWPDGP